MAGSKRDDIAYAGTTESEDIIMASIVQRNGKFSVIYSYVDEVTGVKKQKWETFKTNAEAKRRKTEIEYQKELGKLQIPNCKTLDELLVEYVSLYGKNLWSVSYHSSCTGMIRNYISPIIGDMKLNEITARVLEKYYATLLKTEAAPHPSDGKYRKEKRYVAVPTVRKIHNVLRSAFTQAVKWDLMEKNPALYATVPKYDEKKRDIWDAPTLFRALELCKDERLKLCMNLAFACSLRIGELLGLTWDCVDIDEDSMRAGTASIFINKELQRVSKLSLDALEKKDVIAMFPEIKANNKTVLLLKKPKTASSVRKVFLPRTVAEMLIVLKHEQEVTKDALGDEYSDYSLVIAGALGLPIEGSRIETALRKLIQAYDLPPIVFHSLRHSSITYKLRLNGGDIKAVQGDSGHAQAQMVTDKYSHILDEGRVVNARLIEQAFYGNQGAEQVATPTMTVPVQDENVDVTPSGDAPIDAATLLQMLANPELAKLIKGLAQTLGG